jgi:hypothetical protein
MSRISSCIDAIELINSKLGVTAYSCGTRSSARLTPDEVQ